MRMKWIAWSILGWTLMLGPWLCVSEGQTSEQFGKPQGQIWCDRDWRAGVLDVDISPDAKYVAAGSINHTARIFDAATGKPLFLLTGHLGPVTHVRFSGDGTRLATGSTDGVVRVWDAHTGELLARLRQPYHVHSMAINRDGRTVVSGGCVENQIRVWDVDHEKLKLMFVAPGQVNSVDLSPDGKRIIAASGDDLAKDAWLYDGTTGALLQTFSGGTFSGGRFSEDGRLLYLLSDQLLVVDAVTNATLKTIDFAEHFSGTLAISEDGKRILETNRKWVACWDIEANRKIFQFNVADAPVNAVAISRDGRYAATAEGGSGDAYHAFIERLWNPSHVNSASFWDMAARQAAHVELDIGANVVFSLANGSGDTIVGVTHPISGMPKWATVFFDANSGALKSNVPRLLDHPLLSPDGKLLLASGASGALALFDPSDIEAGGRLVWPEEQQLPGEVRAQTYAFAPDGHSAFVQFRRRDPRDRTVTKHYDLGRVDLATRKLAVQFDCPDELVTMAISADGQYLAGRAEHGTTEADQIQTATVWNAQSGKQIFSAPAAYPLLFGRMLPGWIAVSRDGLLACPLPDGVHVWNAPDGKAKYVLNADQGDVVKVEFVADGSSLLTVTRDGLVRRWDAASGKLLAMGTIPQNEPLFDPIFRFGDGGAISILHGSYIDAVTLNPPN